MRISAALLRSASEIMATELLPLERLGRALAHLSESKTAMQQTAGAAAGLFLTGYCWQATRRSTVSTGQSAVVGLWPDTQSDALQRSAVRMSIGRPSPKPLALQTLVAALAQSGAPLPATGQTCWISMIFEVENMAPAAFFIACVASLAASLCCLLNSSSLACCSFILALKLAIESFHHWPKSLRKPRLSFGPDGEAAAWFGARFGA